MSQIWPIVRMELECWCRQRSTYIYFVALLILSFLQVAAMKSGFDGTAPNCPFQVHYIVAGMSMLGLPIVAAVAGGSICKEFSHGTYPLTFTAPISAWQLLTGRFVSSYVVLLAVFSSVSLGCYLGSVMPLVEQKNLVDNSWPAYLKPYVIVLMPNLFFAGALMFALAALGRNMTWVYVSAAMLLAANMAAGVAMRDVEVAGFASIMEPFGSLAFVELAEQATIQEKNTQLVPLSDRFILNRLGWMAIGLLIFLFTLVRFRVGQREYGSSEISHGRGPTMDSAKLLSQATVSRPPNPFSLLPTQVCVEFVSVAARFPFAVIVMVLAWMVLNASRFLGATMGTRVHPITSNMLILGQGGIDLFLFITIVIYSGQLVWRERDAKTESLHDVLPIPSWLPLLSKTIALMLVQALLFAVVMVCAIVVQALSGHYDFEPAVYLKSFFGIEWVHSCLLCVLAVAVHEIVNQKLLAHFVLAICFAAAQVATRIGVEHHLLRYGSHPGYVYSDMDGFGNFVFPILCFNAYWAAVAVLLAVISNAGWVRGRERTLAARLRQAGDRMTRATRIIGGVSLAAMIGLGCFIFYNTNILNEFQSRHTGEELKVEYERAFKSFRNLPHPRITAIKAHADIFPEQRKLRLFGSYQLTNKTDQAVGRMLIGTPPQCELSRLRIGTVDKAIRMDRRSGTRVYELDPPMQPGETWSLEFDLHFSRRGFTNHRADSHIVRNGTYFDASFFPRLGYVSAYELSDARRRRELGLPPKNRVAAIDDQDARRNQIKIIDSDWIDLQLTIGTSHDQVAVAPGSLAGQWEHHGRRYSQYQSDSPLLCFFCIVSARYEVMRDRWNDVDLEIYYHPGHEYNLKAMMKAMKLSLDYYTINFGPYHNKQLRIVEVPRTHPSAKAFSGMIPYSEGLGFILKQRRNPTKDRNIPFFVTAHEVAHQWWAHQVVGADVQGSFMLSETLAQYSALMVMKREFDATVMQLILREELKEYLKGRASSKREMPLALEERQAWVHYQKGSLVMYALQDYLGEDTVNQVLADYVKDTRFQEPPYTTSMELVERFRRVTPPYLAYLIDDLFNAITLHDNRAISATYKRRSDGRYEVYLTVTARKFRGTESVGEEEIPIDDWIDIGVTNGAGNFQYLEKHRVRGNDHKIVLVVSEVPRDAGIDPKNILIDRQPDDNTVRVTQAFGEPSRGEFRSTPRG